MEVMENNAPWMLRRMMQAKGISGFSFGCWFWDYYGLAC